MLNKTSLYIDLETKTRLQKMARNEARNLVDVLRRMVDLYLGALPPFDQAVLHQIAKDEGLDSLLDATSYVIHDWQRLKAALELRCPAPPVDGQPSAPAIRMTAVVAQPEEA